MRPVEHIALAEFARSFGYKSGAPGGRDFFSLSLFFMLAFFLLFMGVAAHEGTRHRFEQVLLGALPHSGPPIHLNSHIDRPEGLTPAVLEKFARDYPYLNVPARDFDGQSGVLVIPGFDIYEYKPEEQSSPPPPPASLSSPEGASGKADVASNERRECQRLEKANFAWRCSPKGDFVAFRGLAISERSPIWRWIEDQGRKTARPTSDEAPQLVVAASRAMFEKHFQYERYFRDVTESIDVPCTVRQDVYAAWLRSKESQAPIDFPAIVLRLREGARLPDTYHVARVIWVDSFPIDRVAMVVPLETYELLLASEGRGRVSVHPETWQSSRRITKISFLDFDRVKPSDAERVRPAFREFAACLGARENDTPLPSMSPERLVCGVIKPAKDAAGNMDLVIKVPRLLMDNQDASLEVDDKHGLRSAEVAKCAARTGLGAYFGPDPAASLPEDTRVQIQLSKEMAAEVRWKRPGLLELPCSVVSEDITIGKDGSVSDPLARGNTISNTCNRMVEAPLSGFHETFVYVGQGKLSASGGQFEASGNSSGLDGIVNSLLNWKHEGRPVFRLDASYEGALVRFGVLSTLLDRVATPLGIGALLMYVFLAAVILMTTFAHRRPQYGLLLMNGMRGLEVAWMVLCQIVMAAVVGGVFGIAVFAIVREEINASLAESTVIKAARKLIGLDMPLFVDLPSFYTITLAWGWLTALTGLVGILVLTAQGVTRAKSPILLLKT